MYTDNVTLLNAVTQTTTSAAYDISLRREVGFQFISSGVSGGSLSFTIDVSNDNVNWITSVAFQDATSVNATTWVTSKTATTNTSTGGFIPIAPWRFIRVVCSISGTATGTVIMEAQS